MDINNAIFVIMFNISLESRSLSLSNIISISSLVLQEKSILVTSYKTPKLIDCSFLQFDLILRMQDLIPEQPLSP